MSIRLTESKLRQIIREEAAKLTRRPTRRLSEAPADVKRVAAQADAMAAGYGLAYYFDCTSPVARGLPVGENVAEDVIYQIPGLDEVMSDTEAVIVCLASGVLRFYDSDSDVLEMALEACNAAGMTCRGVKRIRGANMYMDT
jgi:hypothetical protein